MKTLAVYALVLGTGVMSLLSLFESKEDHTAKFPSLELSSTLELNSNELPSSPSATPHSEVRKKEYHIYFENRAEEPLEVAIRYKDYNGDWQTEGFVTLKSGEKRHMGVSDQKTYFYYAENQHKWRKRKWTGKHAFPVGEAAPNKLRFVKQDIWECYDTKMCNTFAVFR